MAYICYKNPRNCEECRHFRFDEDRGEKACWAEYDNKKCPSRMDRSNIRKERRIKVAKLMLLDTTTGELHTLRENVALNLLPSDVPLRDDYIAMKLWCEEDIRTRLQERQFLGTPEQVAEVINTGYLKYLGDCTDGDWQMIDNAIDCWARREGIL